MSKQFQGGNGVKLKISTLATSIVALLAANVASAEEITVATVNNADMITMQEIAPAWEKATGHKINWVVLEETFFVSGQRPTSPRAVVRSISCSSAHTRHRSGARKAG